MTRTVVKSRLVPIGNSHGVRIPKTLREQCGLSGEVELSVRGKTLVISAARGAREGWSKAFAEMAKRGDDKLLFPEDMRNGWDESEWTW